MAGGLFSAASVACLVALHATAGAQTAVDDSVDYIAPSETPSEPAGPLANTVTAAETVLLPARTPDYFEALYPMFMKAPLPGKIYKQGGIPPLVPQLEVDRNPFGRLGSYLPNGAVATRGHAFFDDRLGRNGRSCATCHQPPSAMSISLRNVKARFRNTNGTDPLFAPVDGANCPTAVPPQYTSGALYGGLKGKGKKALKDAYSLLLTKGLIRIPMPWPPANNPSPEFTIEVVKDLPGCNLDQVFGIQAGFVSVYRRPQISAALNFKTIRNDGVGIFGDSRILPGSLMWDGREPSITSQARSAIFGHAQRRLEDGEPPAAALAQIEQFQNDFFTAQYSFRGAGRTDANGATGGPVALSGKDVNLLTPPPNTPVFNEYDGWANQAGDRASVKRGQDIFHRRPFQLSEVVGSNSSEITIRPAPGQSITIPLPPSLTGTCSICHATEHAGSDNLANPFRDLGVGGSRAGKVVVGAANALDPAPDLPQFKLTCTSGDHPFLGDAVVVNDPGRALFTGRCRDIGSFVVPSLRGLAAREPYFHDGSAKDLRAVVDFYSARFEYLDPANPSVVKPLTEQEKVDLVNFLAAL